MNPSESSSHSAIPTITRPVLFPNAKGLPPPPRNMDRMLAFDLPRRALTEREKEVLRLICEGMSNSEIATRLGISRETVKTELKRLFRKIEVKNRTAAAVMFTRLASR